MVSDNAKTIATIIVVAIALAATTPLFTDAAPGSATIVLTLHNTNGYHAIHYRISVNGEQKLEGDIGIQETVIRTMVISFPIGVRTFYPVQITVDGSATFIGVIGTLRNGQILPVTFDLE